MTDSGNDLCRALRRRIDAPAPLLVPGVADALTARLVEDIGFEAIYISGAAIANTALGMPDIGLVSLDQLSARVANIREAVEKPLIVDADTGFGAEVGVWRTVRTLERSGANAIQLEDQVSPKRCGHFQGKKVITQAEMVSKIHAALDARRDPDLVVIARTDAIAPLGFAEALDRAMRYRDAGADVIFVEAPRTRQELATVGSSVPGPKLVNMVEGGMTPILPADELASFGFSIILYANSALRAALYGMRSVLEHLRNEGSTLGILDRIVTWDERQNLVRKPEFDAFEENASRAAAAGVRLATRKESL